MLLISVFFIVVAVYLIVVFGAESSAPCKQLKLKLRKAQDEKRKKALEEEEKNEEKNSKDNSNEDPKDGKPTEAKKDKVASQVTTDYIDHSSLALFTLAANGQLLAGYIERSRPKEEVELSETSSSGKDFTSWKPIVMGMVRLTAMINGYFSLNSLLESWAVKLPLSIKKFSYPLVVRDLDCTINAKNAINVITALFAFYHYQWKDTFSTNLFTAAIAINAIEICHVSHISMAIKLLLAGIASQHLNLIGLGFLSSGEVRMKLSLPVLFAEEEGREVFLAIGDLVIPAVILAFLYRFDLKNSSNPGKKTSNRTNNLFFGGLISYLVALAIVLAIELTSPRIFLFAIFSSNLVAYTAACGKLSQLQNYNDYPVAKVAPPLKE